MVHQKWIKRMIHTFSNVALLIVNSKASTVLSSYSFIPLTHATQFTCLKSCLWWCFSSGLVQQKPNKVSHVYETTFQELDSSSTLISNQKSISFWSLNICLLNKHLSVQETSWVLEKLQYTYNVIIVKWQKCIYFSCWSSFLGSDTQVFSLLHPVTSFLTRAVRGMVVVMSRTGLHQSKLL